MAALKKVNEKWTRKQIFYFVWLLISIVLFYSFIYNDILETMRVSISFWEELIRGNLHYFYGGRWQQTSVAYVKEVQPVYDFPIYIVFAIWNFPIWLVEHFGKVDVMNSVFCMMWEKTLLLVSVLLITKALYRLCRTLDLNENLSNLACLLFLSSNFFMTSVIMMSAYDIIALYFAIKGIDYYFQGKNKGFLLCFMCAIPLKFFALLLFVPLLLLKEKRIPQIIGSGILSILPILIFRFLLPCRAVMGDASTVSFSLSNMLKSTELSNLAWIYAVYHEAPIAIGQMYLSIAAWIILFLVCYFVKIESQESLRRWGIYACFMSYAILFVLCMSHPYWLLIMMPFMAIMMAQNAKYLYVNMIVEMLLTWGMIFAQIFKFPWCFGNALVNGMFLPLLLRKQSTFQSVTPMTLVNQFVSGDNASSYLIGMGCTVFAAGMLVFSVLNLPCLKDKFHFINMEEKPETWLMVLRMISGIVIAMIPIAMYVIGVKAA